VWDQLRRHVLVNVIDRVYAALGSKLTIPKLAQAVPVAGAVINAGVNAGLIRQTFRRAEAVYRLRFLSEKYGIDPDEWRTDAPAGSDEADEAEGVVQVDQELEAEIEREQGR
jgi:EcsC protein family